MGIGRVSGNWRELAGDLEVGNEIGATFYWVADNLK